MRLADEHLRMIGTRGESKRWTVERAYELVPRLYERRRTGGAPDAELQRRFLGVEPLAEDA